MMRILRYLKHRMIERSTLIAITGSIGAAAVIPAPWCYYSFVMGLVTALTPDADTLSHWSDQ